MTPAVLLKRMLDEIEHEQTVLAMRRIRIEQDLAVLDRLRAQVRSALADLSRSEAMS